MWRSSNSGDSMQAAKAPAASAVPLQAVRPPRSGRVRPLTMPEQIAESITSAILRGEYQPGDPVREQDLADRFEVSRGPIREALRILEKAGVVTIVPQRGAHITQLSAQEVNNLFEIRAALAPLLARHLSTASPVLVRAVKAEVEAMERLAAGDDGWDDYAQVSYRLSQLLFDASGNPQLGEILNSLANQTARYTRLGLRDPARQRASAKGWRRFVDALECGDAENAGDALVDLMEASRKAALEVLSR